jgi:hypothetical protein
MVARALAQRLANLANAEIHPASKIYVGLLTPQLTLDLLPGGGMPGMFCHVGQHLEGLGLKRDRDPPSAQFTVGDIQLEIVESEYLARRVGHDDRIFLGEEN